MNSFDSSEANVNRSPVAEEMPSSSSSETSSGSSESSSHSGNTEKISTPSIKPQKKSSPNSTRNNVTTPSKPSSSIKRHKEPQGKEVSKQPSKKLKKPAQEYNKGKAAAVSEAEKSLKKNYPSWNAKDEVAFLKKLAAFCEKGKGLPKNFGVFYEAVKNDLDGDYSNERLYNKVRGLKGRFFAVSDKIKDKSFAGFKNSHEEILYRMSKQIWGNREEEEGSSEKADQGDNATGVKKKKRNVVDNEGERKEVKRNKNGDVRITLKEQEKEEEEEEDEEEDENDDEEEGEGHDQGEENANVNSSQPMKEVKIKKRKEDGPSHVAVTGTQRSEMRMGEKEVSSEEDVGEEQDSSDEDEKSESEPTDNENSALPDSNAAVELSKYSIGGSSTARNLYSALKQANGRGNSTNNVSNGVSKGSRRVGTAVHYEAGENSRQHVVERLSDRRKVSAAGNHDAAENLAQNVPNGTANGSLGMTDQHQMFDQLCKENLRIFQDMLDGFKNGILNILDTVKKDLQDLRGSSNTARATGLDFSMTKGFSFGRELPLLSKTEAEMIDRKWEMQQFIEMEAASKHLALLQEEYQLRMEKFRHQ